MKKSPFPGMDPFLESGLWPDFHNSYMASVKRELVPRLPDNIIINVETAMLTDEIVFGKIKSFKPDVSLWSKGDDGIVQEPESTYGHLTPATLVAPAPREVEMKQHSIMIYNHQSGTLVAAIEMLSPTNKRAPNLKAYRKKRAEFLNKGVHLLELDFLRAGTRPYYPSTWPDTHYSVQLVNAKTKEITLWALTIKDRLPAVSIPLLNNMPSLSLDLQSAFDDTYNFSSYPKSLAYHEPLPKPTLSEADLDFVREAVTAK